MWHETRDMWHMTCDRWGEVKLLSKCQLPSSYGLGVKVFWRYFLQRITDSDYKLINHEGVCRTSPATPGLLNIYKQDNNAAALERSKPQPAALPQSNCKVVTVLHKSSLNSHCKIDYWEKPSTQEWTVTDILHNTIGDKRIPNYYKLQCIFTFQPLVGSGSAK